ncbi:DUF7475 family protein [Halopelagius longus]|uniref:Uncharacterized protein n=2 Tax=Halopelagius longus TaxID=1236180 RepID=A0A1H1FZZ9_9EURY|nr:hypothetical protein [Halopelagius longus]RDI69941.1 hypothetical protein DWB78_17500 [Halopelagius longus]SDR06218.1 hypothetical protein SAMN05216278_3413 [Halopelagius longus]
MSEATTNTPGNSLITGVPSGVVPYVMIAAALVSAGIHLWLVPVVVAFDTTQAVLFVLAAVGFIAGVAVYVTRYWRREFYVFMVLLALAQIVAYFVMGGPANAMAFVSKAAEAVVALAAAYLYTTAEPSGSAI